MQCHPSSATTARSPHWSNPFRNLRSTRETELALEHHPKTIETVLKHSSITLSMDTHGHLFPGQESAAVNKLHATMVGPSVSLLATPLILEENADSCGCAAPDAAPKNGNAPIDPELASVIESWDTLPPAIREAILAMLRAAE